MTESRENRRRRWIIFSVLALIYILVYFYRVSLAVVAGDITRDLKLTPQQLGGLSGVLFYVYAVAQLPLGPMIDRIGSRKVISGCGVLTAIGGILFSQAESLTVAMIARILIGIGTASVLMATFTIFSHWFSKQEFGRVSGFMVAVGNLGNLAATAPLALAVAAIGWRQSFLIIGIFQIAVTALVFIMVRDRPNRDKECDHHEPVSGKPSGMMAAWGEIFGKADFLLLGMIAFAWYGNYLALQGLWGGPYLMEALHLSREETGKLLMFTSIGFIAGSMVIDSIARKIFNSYKRTLLAGQLLLLILMSVFIGPADTLPQTLFIPLFFLIGFAVSSGVMI
ncbi:MAG: MFS transporter, partial [Geobacteraceae bacterium GWC2_48_7]